MKESGEKCCGRGAVSPLTARLWRAGIKLIETGLSNELPIPSSGLAIKIELPFDDAQCLVLSCSSIILSLFSIVVSLSRISLSILPSSSCGPMYCPGLSGEGSGSIGLGRSWSGRLGRSNKGRSRTSSLRFQGFHGLKL